MAKYFFEKCDHSEPSEADILEYAHQIGINVKNEFNLMWIAKEGLSAAVPEPWIILADENDRIYYHNRKTGQSTWSHPVDEKFAIIVQEERAKSKSLHSTCSDPGFESKLSSLADAPPLSSGGKDTPSFPKQTKNKNDTSSARKMEVSRFENRRGTQLAAVKLNTLKMPVSATHQKPSGTVTFMPKGSSLMRNLRRPMEEPSLKRNERQSDIKGRIKNTIPSFEANNSDNSDEASKYSYEDTDYDEDNINDDDIMNKFDSVDPSPLSPIYSAEGSPEPLDVNPLVLEAKKPNRLDIPKQLPKMQGLLSKDQFSPLSRRQMQDQYPLKPVQKNIKQKSGPPKKTKNVKKSDPKISSDQTDVSSDILNYDEMEGSFQEEWRKTLEKLEKEEAAKYQELTSKMFKRLEEEESKLKKENEERIAKLQSELTKSFNEEQLDGKSKIQALINANSEKLKQEEDKFTLELKTQTQAFEQEIKQLESEKLKEINAMKDTMKEKETQEIASLQQLHESNLKNVKESHKTELEVIEKAHQEEMKKLQEIHQDEKEAPNKIAGNAEKFDMKGSLQANLEDLKKLIKDEEKKYQALKDDILKVNKEYNLLIEKKDHVKSELVSENEALSKIIEKKNIAQSDIEQIQEEAESLENDSELLRNEKSALISELFNLKESIKSHNLTTKKLSQKENSFVLKTAGCQTTINSSNASCQISNMQIIGITVSCQTANISLPNSNSFSQTDKCSYVSKSCQVEGIFKEDVNLEKQNVSRNQFNENLSIEALVNKNLETALGSLKLGIDERIKSMEQHLRSLQEKISAPIMQDQSDHNSDAYRIEDEFQSHVPCGDSTNIHNACTSHKSYNNAQNSLNHVKRSSHHCCKCQLGNTRSCDIMEDLKNSVYNLNHIVNRSFSPSYVNPYVSNTRMPSFLPHTSSLQTFYNQYRSFQDKKSQSDLDFKCQNGILRQTRASQEKGDDEYYNSVSRKISHPATSPADSPHMTHNSQENYIIRARNVVLREQARVWKQQQQQFINSSSAQTLSENLPAAENCQYQSICSANVSAAFTVVPSFDSSFSPYETEASLDYNTWMSRLNALQQRIRSHNHKLV